MTLNPLALLEKLINEHGSATILSKQLELAKDQFAAHERKLLETTTENGVLVQTNRELESRNKDLQSQLRAQGDENEILKKQIKDTYEKDHGRKPEQVIILQLLHPENGRSLQHIARQCGISERAAAFHLQSLSMDGLVYSDDFPEGAIWDTGATVPESTWMIRQPGLEYLANNGLLQ